MFFGVTDNSDLVWGALATIVFLCGPVVAIAAVYPVLRASERSKQRVQLTISDLFSLVLYASTCNGFILPLVEDAADPRAKLMLILFNILGAAWWIILVIGISRLRINRFAPRILYVGLAAPGSFLAIYYPIMLLLTSNISPTKLSTADWVRLGVCVVACVALFPISRWTLRHAEDETAQAKREGDAPADPLGED